MSARDSPSQTMPPSVGVSIPARRLRRVDLPLPLGPVMAYIFPASNSAFTSRSTAFCPPG